MRREGQCDEAERQCCACARNTFVFGQTLLGKAVNRSYTGIRQESSTFPEAADFKLQGGRRARSVPNIIILFRRSWQRASDRKLSGKQYNFTGHARRSFN